MPCAYLALYVCMWFCLMYIVCTTDLYNFTDQLCILIRWRINLAIIIIKIIQSFIVTRYRVFCGLLSSSAYHMMIWVIPHPGCG